MREVGAIPTHIFLGIPIWSPFFIIMKGSEDFDNDDFKLLRSKDKARENNDFDIINYDKLVIK